MQWMNLNHLRYFLTIAEEGSLSAASKKLMVGQPALSVQLKQFEEWLNLKLFDRVGRKFVITQSGEYVLKYAKGIKALEEELMANIGHAQEGIKKEYVIGAVESVPKTILAQAISAISAIDSAKLKVIEGKGDELFQLLVAHKIDFFIGNIRPMSEGKEMLYTSLGKEDVSVWGSKKFLSLKKNFPKSIENRPFILPGFQNQIRHDFERFMLKSGLHFEVTIEAQDTALQKALASRSEGLVVLGDESAAAWAKIGQLHHIGKLPGIKEEYWLGMVKKSMDNELIKEIVKSFK
jgi:LysR family transcriptional activator of nhaA